MGGFRQNCFVAGIIGNLGGFWSLGVSGRCFLAILDKNSCLMGLFESG